MESDKLAGADGDSLWGDADEDDEGDSDEDRDGGSDGDSDGAIETFCRLLTCLHNDRESHMVSGGSSGPEEGPDPLVLMGPGGGVARSDDEDGDEAPPLVPLVCCAIRLLPRKPWASHGGSAGVSAGSMRAWLAACARHASAVRAQARLAAVTL